jgi:hypothetical protein
VGQFLQRAYFVAGQFRRRRGDFERLQVHPFFKQSGLSRGTGGDRSGSST